MNNRKSILYILLTVLGLILLYNYMLVPLLMQYNTEMGMGMHWNRYTSANYFIDIRIILLVVLIVAGLLLLELIKPQTKGVKCSKCRKEIEDDRWKVCPVCGNPVENRKG